MARQRHIISSFSYPLGMEAVVEEFGKIAKREDRSASELIIGFISDYVKAHGSGNPVYPLDDFLDGKMLALPTPWQDPTSETARRLSKEDKKFMLAQMAKWYKAIQ